MAFPYSRIEKLVLIFLLVLGLLLGRLFYWQIIQGYDLALEAFNMRMQEIPISVARGDILDKNGKPLTNTGSQYSVFVFPGQIKDVEETIVKLNTVIPLPESAVNNLIKKTQPFRLITGLEVNTAREIDLLALRGIVAADESKRYDYKAIAAHVIGYTNFADNKGVSGIEGLCDELLQGSQAEYVAAMVDAGQKLIPGLGYKKLKLDAGGKAHDIILTIDKPVQQAVEGIMDGNILKGAVIVLNSNTGEILAMASRPNFNANNLDEYLYKNSAPLLNRAISAYQPGSVFKLVVAAAALEGKYFKAEDIFYDSGYIDVNQNRFWSWDYEQGGRGRINFTEALAFSSNSVFIEIALKMGGEKIIDMAEKMGFAAHSNLGFNDESEGSLPAVENLYPGDLANLAIGQGLCEATPLQIAGAVAVIANGGLKIEPYLISKLSDKENGVVKDFQKSQLYPNQRVISEETAKTLQKMMTAVTRYGTGRAAYLESVGSAGKTGSAETGRMGKDGNGVNHAWFAGYTPLENPKYVIVVFVEDGMSGSNVAAPIFRQVAAEVMRLKP